MGAAIWRYWVRPIEDNRPYRWGRPFDGQLQRKMVGGVIPNAPQWDRMGACMWRTMARPIVDNRPSACCVSCKSNPVDASGGAGSGASEEGRGLQAWERPPTATADNHRGEWLKTASCLKRKAQTPTDETERTKVEPSCRASARRCTTFTSRRKRTAATCAS